MENTFTKRFAKLPVKIALLSRLQTKLEQKKIIKDLKEGLAIIEDDQKTASYNRGYYIIVKDNIYMNNKVLTFWNKEYNISASINKSALTQLIDWLESIKF